MVCVGTCPSGSRRVLSGSWQGECLGQAGPLALGGWESGTQGLSPSSLGVQESHQLVLTVQGGLGGPRGQGPWPGRGEQKAGCWVGGTGVCRRAGRERPGPQPRCQSPPAACPLPAPSPSSRKHTFTIGGRSPVAPGPRDVTRLPAHCPTCGGDTECQVFGFIMISELAWPISNYRT